MAPDYYLKTTPRNPFWEIVKGFVTPLPPTEQVNCQYPKPILLDTVRLFLLCQAFKAES